MNKYYQQTSLILILLFFISTASLAQYSGEKNSYNNDYNRARREVQQAYEKQADLNRQPNSPSGNNSTSLSPEQSQSFEDLLRRAAGKPTRAEEKSAKSKADSVRQKNYEAFKKKEAEERAVWIKELQIDRDNAAPVKARLLQEGFLEVESYNMSRNYIWNKKYNLKETDSYSDYLFEAGKNLLYLKQNIITDKYEPLMYATAKLVNAKSYITANDFLDIMDIRFPDKQAEIDLFRINVFANYFEEYAGTGSRYYKGFGKRMIDSYFALEDRTPSSWASYKAVIGDSKANLYSPYEAIASYYEMIVKDQYSLYSKKEIKHAKKQIEYFNNRRIKMEDLKTPTDNTNTDNILK
jgi:hypothetical protein